MIKISKQILFVLIGGLLGLSTAKAEEKAAPPQAVEKSIKTYPQRKLSLNLGSIYDYENNDQAWFSLSQLLGKGNDYLGIEQEGDEEVWSRIGLIAAALYFQKGIEYYAHEIAHEFNISDRNFTIHFDQWFGNVGQTSPYPQFEHIGPVKGPNETILKSVVDGLNQNSYSSSTSWEESLLKRELVFDEGIYFLVQQLNDSLYVVASSTYSFEKQKGKTNSSIEYDDVYGYIDLLNKSDVGFTRKEYLGQAVAVDLLSWHIWESFYSVYNYLVSGERVTTPTTVEVIDGWDVSPPLFSLYLTPQGSFVNANFFVFHGGKSLELSAGSDLDYAGGGKLDTLRFGAKERGVKLSLIELIPFSYVNLERSSFEGKGVSTGLEMLLSVTTSASVRGKWEYNHHDVIESGIKSEGNGNSFVLGVDIKI